VYKRPGQVQMGDTVLRHGEPWRVTYSSWEANMEIGTSRITLGFWKLHPEMDDLLVGSEVRSEYRGKLLDSDCIEVVE
jgi:hypothetical protein